MDQAKHGEKQMKAIEWILNRLREPSTWRGLVGGLSLVGVKLAPSQADSIITAGVAIIAAIEVFKKDANSPDVGK